MDASAGRRLLERLRELGARPRIGPLLLATPIIGLTVLFVITGLRGVDFGYHWDEMEFHVTPIRTALASGILLPRAYIYPSFEKWVLLWATLPAGLRAALETNLNPTSVQKAMLAAFDAPAYLLSARSLFIVISSLGIVWVYGAARALRMKRWVALVAASGLGLSWEFAYHARFAVADGTLVQFTALTLFMLALYIRHKRARWLYASAIAAGLATGTKYPGVFLLIPVLLTSLPSRPFRRVPAQLLRSALLCPLAFVAFVIVTPGALLDPFKFIEETRWISTAYTHGHGGYTAHDGWDHARIALTFLSVSFFSASKIVAVTMFAGVLAGFGFWLKADRRVALTLASFPVLFLLHFCSHYIIVVVRNYLFITPFLCLFLGRAVAELDSRIANRLVRRGLAGVLAAVLVGQAAWLISAGESIRHVRPKKYVAQALDYVADRSDLRFRLSPKVLKIARAEHMKIPANVSAGPEATKLVYWGRDEAPAWWWDYRTNDPWLTDAVFGPREMNFNYYVTWGGSDRVVIMSRQKARLSKIPAAQ